MREFLELPEIRNIFERAKEVITSANAEAHENALFSKKLRGFHGARFHNGTHWTVLSELYMEFFELGRQYFSKTPGEIHLKVSQIHREWADMIGVARAEAVKSAKRKKRAIL